MGGMIVVQKCERADGVVGFDLLFWCPACRCTHGVSTRGPGPVWTFNGDYERPTFAPSLKMEIVAPKTAMEPEKLLSCCHLVVTCGRISYEGDCTHGMAGRVIDMEEF